MNTYAHFPPRRYQGFTIYLLVALAYAHIQAIQLHAKTLQVGPSEALKSLHAALEIALAGDIIQITEGKYSGALRINKRVALISKGGKVTLGLSNKPPYVNSGAHQEITGYRTELSGSASDDGLPNDPGKLSVQWTLVSGPGSATFDAPYSKETYVTVSTLGKYAFRLKVSDGELSVSDDVEVRFKPGSIVVPNLRPTVKIAQLGTIVLPSSAFFNATVADDGLPNPPGKLDLSWSKVSGPGEVIFNPGNQANTQAKFTATGDYLVRLTAYDGQLAGIDELRVVVRDSTPENEAPIPNAGPDQQIELGRSVTLVGNVRDDGNPRPPGKVTASWSKVSGPGTVTFQNATSLSATAMFSKQGRYEIALNATDGQLQGTDTTIIRVVSTQNAAPTVNAGSGQSVDLPDSAYLNGKATDDGRPTSPGRLDITWSKVRGPGGVAFGTPNQPNTTATFSAPGSYLLRLTASDSEMDDWDNVEVTVKEARDYLSTYENIQAPCGDSGRELRIKNNHARRSISFVLILRLRTLYSGEFNETIRGTLAPGESQRFACSDSSAGPGYGYVSHRITGANFVGTSPLLTSFQENAIYGPELTSILSPGEFRISWPAFFEDGVLESIQTFDGEPQWEPVLQTSAVEYDRRIVTLPVDQASRFFRLRLP